MDAVTWLQEVEYTFEKLAVCLLAKTHGGKVSTKKSSFLGSMSTMFCMSSSILRSFLICSSRMVMTLSGIESKPMFGTSHAPDVLGPKPKDLKSDNTS